MFKKNNVENNKRIINNHSDGKKKTTVYSAWGGFTIIKVM